MKRPFILLLCFFALAFFIAKAPAQCSSGNTQGRDFWLMFLQNGVD